MENNSKIFIRRILDELFYLAKHNTVKSILITGGRSATSLYKYWYKNSDLNFFKSARIYFSDERCVSKSSLDSNYGMVLRAFSHMIPENKFERIRGEAKNPQKEALRYHNILPSVFDIVLLSVGEDGHIASLFPSNKACFSHMKMEYIDDAPKPPSKRITITPKVIQKATHKIIMAEGETKGQILAHALCNPKKFSDLPVRLTLGSTWILDRKASIAFQKYKPKNFHKTKIIYA